MEFFLWDDPLIHPCAIITRIFYVFRWSLICDSKTEILPAKCPSFRSKWIILTLFYRFLSEYLTGFAVLGARLLLQKEGEETWEASWSRYEAGQSLIDGFDNVHKPAELPGKLILP